MIIDFSEVPSFVAIKVNGRLVGEIAIGEVFDEKDLLAEVEKARRLEAMPKFLKMLSKGAARFERRKIVKYYEGFADGLEQKTVKHPSGPGVPDMIPCYETEYREGYSIGEAIARNLQGIDQLELILNNSPNENSWERVED